MAREEVIRLIGYGDREFGDDWWPVDARAWLTPDKAAELRGLLRDPASDQGRAAELVNEYGEAKFGPKWCPGPEVAALSLA